MRRMYCKMRFEPCMLIYVCMRAATLYTCSHVYWAGAKWRNLKLKGNLLSILTKSLKCNIFNAQLCNTKSTHWYSQQLLISSLCTHLFFYTILWYYEASTDHCSIQWKYTFNHTKSKLNWRHLNKKCVQRKATLYNFT